MIPNWNYQIEKYLDITKDECLKTITVLEEDTKGVKCSLTSNMVFNLKHRLILLIASINMAIEDQDNPDKTYYYINLEDRSHALYLITMGMSNRIIPLTTDIIKNENILRLILDNMIIGMERLPAMERTPII
jgi:hypothetical protein